MSDKKQGVVIRVGGGKEIVEFTDESLYTVATDVVGGYIELVSINTPVGHLDMYLNEEGKLDGLPINALATSIANLPGDIIVGDVIIVGDTDDEGNNKGLTPEQVKYFS